MRLIKKLSSKYFSKREDQIVDVVVLHSMYAPKSKTPFRLETCKKLLDRYEVSAHYIIDRRGGVINCVDLEDKAWHAGESLMPPPDSRSGVNAFSIGIELIGPENGPGFTKSQYEALRKVFKEVANKFKIKSIVSHKVIAPTRKTDPWNINPVDVSKIAREEFGKRIKILL